MKIVDYVVVEWRKWVNGGRNDGSLSDIVKQMIGQGYQPIGGVCIEDDVWYQAMVKYEEDPKDTLQTVEPKIVPFGRLDKSNLKNER